MQTSLRGIAKRSASHKTHRFGGLYSLLNQANLKECFGQLNKRAAPGVDRQDYSTYKADLEVHIGRLVEDLKQKRYRAKLVQRHYIPKENGKRRALGIPVVGDKLLQLAASRILEAIYESDFLPSSYAYRPGRGAKDAVNALRRELEFGNYSWVVDADIAGYFDAIDHEWLLKMVEVRVDDKPFVSLIRKWLKAGILETDGRVLHPVTGTPQGGVISPILANIYLHYVLDLWYEKAQQPTFKGRSVLIRYADDFIAVFEDRSDAEAYYRKLRDRLAKFGLSLSEEKSRIQRFNREDGPGNGFDFLGFELHWRRSRAGKVYVNRRTSRKKYRSSLQRFNQWIRSNRNKRLSELLRSLQRKYEGHWNYYGVIGNMQSLSSWYYRSLHILFKWLNRRSQRRSYTWEGFLEMLRQHGISKPRISEQVVRRQWTLFG